MNLIARYGSSTIPVEVERYGSGYRVRLGEKTMIVDLARIGPFVHSLRLEDGTQLALMHHVSGTDHEITLSGSTVRVEIVDPLTLRRKRREDEEGSAGIVHALMPGRIVRVLVAKGESVVKGAGLLILEAMKMENEIQAPADGLVDEVFVEPGQTVEGGAPLVHIAAP